MRRMRRKKEREHDERENRKTWRMRLRSMRRRRRERGNCGALELLPDTNMDGGAASSTDSNIANLSVNIYI